MKIKFYEEFSERPANIKVVGIGGGGGNAVNRMIEARLKGAELVVINTDSQALRKSHSHVRIQIGEKLSRGLGAGGNPVLGRQAAEENSEIIQNELKGADMVFVTAGMGGGTGTGASPVVAELARSMGALTVGVVTYPFELEGKVRISQAEEGINALRPHVDTLLVIPNEKLFEIAEKDMSWQEAFHLADDVLRQAIQAITDVITVTGVINVDFADVKAIMTGAGEALMGIGESAGPDRATKAMRAAIKSPLLENISIEGARGVLINVTGGKDFKMPELKDVMGIVNEFISHDAHVYYGQVIDTSLSDSVKVTLIATGFPSQKRPNPLEEKKTRKNKDIYNRTTSPSGEDISRPAYLRYKCRKLT